MCIRDSTTGEESILGIYEGTGTFNGGIAIYIRGGGAVYHLYTNSYTADVHTNGTTTFGGSNANSSIFAIKNGSKTDVIGTSQNITEIYDGMVNNTYEQKYISSDMNVNGNLGVGVDNPAYKLHVAGNAGFSSHIACAGFYNNSALTQMTGANCKLDLRTTAEGQECKIFMGTPFQTASKTKTAIIAKGLNSYSRADLRFCMEFTGNNDVEVDSSDANTRMIIKTLTGNVGIGLTAPIRKLEVNGDAGFSGAVYIQNSDMYFTKTDHVHTGWGNTVGYAAIENCSHYDALMILGRQSNPGGTRNVEIWDRLEVHGSFVNSSDQRLKRDIVSLNSTDMIDKITRIRGVNFKWVEDKFETWIDTTTHVGFIAQEVEQEFPEFVSSNGRGFKSVEYTSFIPVLLECVKELKTKNDILETDNTNLKNRVQSLEADNTNLKNKVATLETELAAIKSHLGL